MRKFRNASLLLLVILLFLMSSMGVFATSQETAAMATLTSEVRSALATNEYSLAEGGSITGSNLFERNENYSSTGVYTINEANFNRLSSSAQSEFISDIVDESNTVQNSEEDVSETTVELWWKELQTKEGVGSKFLTEILKNTKPDFVSANRIYQPFSGMVGKILGLGCVLICALLGISMTCDIVYITLPPVQAFANDNSDGRKGGIKSFLFSAAAKNSVKLSEQSMNGNGTWRQALGIYFKHQAVALILLGICLLYLVSGQLYTLVGWILDLLRGFLHF